MTKKDYIIVANAIAKAMIDVDDYKKSGRTITSAETFQIVLKFLMADFGADNQKFSDDKFLKFINQKIAEFNQ